MMIPMNEKNSINVNLKDGDQINDRCKEEGQCISSTDNSSKLSSHFKRNDVDRLHKITEVSNAEYQIIRDENSRRGVKTMSRKRERDTTKDCSQIEPPRKRQKIDHLNGIEITRDEKTVECDSRLNSDAYEICNQEETMSDDEEEELIRKIEQLVEFYRDYRTQPSFPGFCNEDTFPSENDFTNLTNGASGSINVWNTFIFSSIVDTDIGEDMKYIEAAFGLA